MFLPTVLYNEIHVGGKAEVGPELPIGGIYIAIVTVVDRVLDAASGTFGVRLALPNPDFLLPAGIAARAHLKIKPPKRQLRRWETRDRKLLEDGKSASKAIAQGSF